MTLGLVFHLYPMAQKENFKNFLPVVARFDRAIFDNANGTSPKTLVTASNYDTIIYSIAAFSDDSSDLTLVFSYNDGAASEPFEQVVITANAGNDASTPTERLELIETLNARTDSNNNSYLLLPSGWSLEANLTSAPAAGQKVVILCSGEDFG